MIMIAAVWHERRSLSGFTTLSLVTSHTPRVNRAVQPNVGTREMDKTHLMSDFQYTRQKCVAYKFNAVDTLFGTQYLGSI